MSLTLIETENKGNLRITLFSVEEKKHNYTLQCEMVVRYRQRMLESRKESPKAENDQGSFAEEKTPRMRFLQEKEELGQEGKDKRITSEAPGLKH